MSNWIWRCARIALVVVLLTTGSLSSSLFINPEKAAAYTFPTYTKTWSGQVQYTNTSLLHIAQDGSFTFTYRKDFPLHGFPVKFGVNWLDCGGSGVAGTLSITWCGFTRYYDSGGFPTIIDVGYNWTYSNPFGSNDCWLRRRLTMNPGWKTDLWVYGEVRQGCH